MFNRLLVTAVALALAACQPAPEAARPALWQADGPGGERAWLLGTIHTLPEPVSLDSVAFNRVLAAADRLVVEVAALEDDRASALAFHKLAAVASAPPLAARTHPPDRAALAAVLEQTGLPPDRFNQMDTWAAALTLAQAIGARSGNSGAHGIDRLILRAMRGKPVSEFEGVERQLAIFDALPESEQRDLLGAVIRSAAGARAEQLSLQRAYLRGDAEALAALDHAGLLADPELRQALLVARNQAWLAQLEPMLRQGEKPLVAVGALHLVGADGLIAGLQARGFRVRRLQ